MDIEDPIIQCQGWQKRNVKIENWTRKMKEELGKIGLAYV
jgi:hypothetical protein